MFSIATIEVKNIIKSIPDIWTIVNENGQVDIRWPDKKESLPLELENLIRNQVAPKSNWVTLKCSILMSQFGIKKNKIKAT